MQPFFEACQDQPMNISMTLLSGCDYANNNIINNVHTTMSSYHGLNNDLHFLVTIYTIPNATTPTSKDESRLFLPPRALLYIVYINIRLRTMTHTSRRI